MEPLSQFKAIGVDNTIYYVLSVDEVAITPIKITTSGPLYTGTYKGQTYCFDARSGGGGEENILLKNFVNNII